MQPEHSVADLCDALQVSRSGYHAWAARTPGPRAQANARLWTLIEQAHPQSRQTYGAPRVWQLARSSRTWTAIMICPLRPIVCAT
jgi:putative transposase